MQNKQDLKTNKERIRYALNGEMRENGQTDYRPCSPSEANACVLNIYDDLAKEHKMLCQTLDILIELVEKNTALSTKEIIAGNIKQLMFDSKDLKQTFIDLITVWIKPEQLIRYLTDTKADTLNHVVWEEGASARPEERWFICHLANDGTAVTYIPKNKLCPKYTFRMYNAIDSIAFANKCSVAQIIADIISYVF